jgi:hypothetical protein
VRSPPERSDILVRRGWRSLARSPRRSRAAAVFEHGISIALYFWLNMKKQTMCHAWNGLSTLAIAIGMTAITACTEQVTNGAGGSPPSTTSAGGAPPSLDCSGFTDDPMGPAMPVHIVNHRLTPVFLNEACNVHFYVVDGAGTKRPAEGDPYGTSCEKALKGNYFFGDCMSYYKQKIEPGATLTTTWYGSLYEIKTMPDDCKDPSLTPDYKALQPQCERAVAPQPGPMTFVLQLDESDDYPPLTFEVSKPFVFGTDTSIEIDVN